MCVISARSSTTASNREAIVKKIHARVAHQRQKAVGCPTKIFVEGNPTAAELPNYEYTTIRRDTRHWRAICKIRRSASRSLARSLVSSRLVITIAVMLLHMLHVSQIHRRSRDCLIVDARRRLLIFRVVSWLSRAHLNNTFDFPEKVVRSNDEEHYNNI